MNDFERKVQIFQDAIDNLPKDVQGPPNYPRMLEGMAHDVSTLQVQLSYARVALEVQRIEAKQVQDQLSEALSDEIRAHARTRKIDWTITGIFATLILFDYSLRGIIWWLS